MPAFVGAKGKFGQRSAFFHGVPEVVDGLFVRVRAVPWPNATSPRAIQSARL